MSMLIYKDVPKNKKNNHCLYQNNGYRFIAQLLNTSMKILFLVFFLFNNEIQIFENQSRIKDAD